MFNAFMVFSVISISFIDKCRPYYVASRIKSAQSKSLSSVSKQLPQVVLYKGKARLFQDGNPLVYGGAVKELNGNPLTGDIVIVTDHMGNIIGKGIYNSISTYRVRMFTRSYEKEYDLSFPNLLALRVRQAVDMRRVCGLPTSSVTTAFRAINGEGDRLGGLIVDMFDSTVVVQSSAQWVELYRKEIEETLAKALGLNKQYIWRQAEGRLKQDGVNMEKQSKEVDSGSDFANYGADVESLNDDNHQTFVNSEGSNEPVLVHECAVKYLLNPEDGQKTGFYCDQRDNRQIIRGLSSGKSVLDAYCYSGGFAINAALGGATAVLAVDSSQSALDAATANARLNGMEKVISFEKGDAVELMRRLSAEGKLFDVVICDPPKLAPTRASLERAKSKYIKINTLAMSLVRPGGLLMTCSCSAAVTQTGALRSIVFEAGKISRRDITVLRVLSAGADHPVHIGYPEGAYLSAILLHIN